MLRVTCTIKGLGLRCPDQPVSKCFHLVWTGLDLNSVWSRYTHWLTAICIPKCGLEIFFFFCICSSLSLSSLSLLWLVHGFIDLRKLCGSVSPHFPPYEPISHNCNHLCEKGSWSGLLLLLRANQCSSSSSLLEIWVWKREQPTREHSWIGK